MDLGYVPTGRVFEILRRSARTLEMSLHRLDRSSRTIESSRELLRAHEVRCPRCSRPIVDFDAVAADGDDLVHERCVAQVAASTDGATGAGRPTKRKRPAN